MFAVSSKEEKGAQGIPLCFFGPRLTIDGRQEGERSCQSAGDKFLWRHCYKVSAADRGVATAVSMIRGLQVAGTPTYVIIVERASKEF
ncbi:hypothetical protein TNCV_3421051 [Trichonephila clavipes]|nr:hypothetical protein TNCV_3421051 [Trichonephila clavipes]